jgi:ABC-type lipoprotein export system ATPase subunit
MEKIRAEQVSYTYQTRYQKVQAVKNATCSFEQGKIYAITGESGSGKSTLLSLLAGLDLPTSGELYVDGKPMRWKNRDIYRQMEASVVYQAFHLLPLLTVAENVMLPMEMNKVPKTERRERAAQLLHSVGLSDDMHEKFPKMMSGGEQQRVAIARAMAAGGRILLADEPTGNLDSKNEQNIVDILVSLAHEEDYLVIVVTHNQMVAQRTDMVYRMKDGVLLQQV